MKKPSRLTVILYAVCAVVWTMRAIQEVIYQTYNNSVFWLVLDILCTVIWIVVFVVTLKRYHSYKED